MIVSAIGVASGGSSVVSVDISQGYLSEYIFVSPEVAIIVLEPQNQLIFRSAE